MTRNLQYQLSNGTWMDCDDDDEAEYYLSLCDKNNNMSRDEVLEMLESGQTIRRNSEDWYGQCRYEPAPVKRVEPEMVECDCGCRVPSGCVMTTSMGTACPNCYDEMSD